MKIIKTKFKDLLVIKSKIFHDKRGYFREISLEKLIKKRLIFTVISKSKKNVLRGMHFQHKKPQGKYISVLKGEIFDVAVDCRRNSKTFGKHFKIILNDKDNVSIYIPPGFAHGFVSLKKENMVLYSCTNYRDIKSESGIAWNDPDLSINWPIKKPTLSSKDRLNKSFKFYFD
jgi:dTDP-4-dehydrorhamnose 3,5-epimerase